MGRGELAKDDITTTKNVPLTIVPFTAYAPHR